MRRMILAAATVGLLAGCGQGESGGGADPAPPVPTSPVPTVSELTDAERTAALAALPAPYSQADLDNGRRVFARCRSCHTITPGGPNMTGPNLHGIFGRTAGTHPGFNYSAPVKTAGFAWNAAQVDDWLENPRTFLPGNKMIFPGLPKADDRRDVIAFLQVETAPN